MTSTIYNKDSLLYTNTDTNTDMYILIYVYRLIIVSVYRLILVSVLYMIILVWD